jgi:hypothetical protein
VPSIALAADPGRGHRLYSLLPDFSGAQTFDLSATPGLDIDAPSQVVGTSIHLSGTVNPSGFSATGRFEYSEDGGTTYQATPVQNLGSGSSAVAISADITGLTPVHDYKIRLVGTSSAGTVRTAPLTVQTTTNRPIVVTGRAVDRTTTSATLLGELNPGGLQTVYHVEYGTSSSYGSRMPVNYDQVAGNGAVNRPISIGVSGLSPGTTYHYRLVAKNPQGQSEGADRTFVTTTSSSGRAYEQVSPVSKGGGGVSLDPVQTSNGDAVVFRTHTASPGSSAGPKFPTYIARRGATGWLSKNLDIPQGVIPGGTVFQTIVGVSNDLTKVVGVSSAKLADGAVDGGSNFYLRDTASGGLRTIAGAPGMAALLEVEGSFGYANPVTGASDFGAVLISPMNIPFLPNSNSANTLRWTDGQLTNVSVDEHDVAFPATASPTGATLSADGHRLFYAFPGTSSLYVRDHDQVVRVSTTHADWGPITEDGRFALLTGEGLTSDSPSVGSAMYRYDVDARQLTFIAPVGGAGSILGASADGRYAYFASAAVLAPGGVPGGSIYAWHDGAFTFVAHPTVGGDTHFQASANGRYFAFTSYSNLTGYDPRTTTGCAPSVACPQVYRFDLDKAELTCASCRLDDAAPTGYSSLGLVLDDGRVLFDSPEPLAAGDTNSKRDVYSFDGTQATLISAGTGAGDSTFVGGARDGRDVFFATGDRLVGQDLDSEPDVYDAREGGGIAAQGRPAETAPCEGEGCLGALTKQSPVPQAGVVDFADQANLGVATVQSSNVKVRVAHKTIRGAVFTLTVKTANKGRIVASGAGLTTVSRTATKAGSYKLTVHLTATAKKRLKARHRLAVRVRLVFTPTNATPSSTIVSLTLKG